MAFALLLRLAGHTFAHAAFTMPTYFDIILEAVHALSKTPKGRAGFVAAAVTKWCLEHHPSMWNMGKYRTTLRKALEDAR